MEYIYKFIGGGCLGATLSAMDFMYTTLELYVWLHSDKPVTNYTACYLLIRTVVGTMSYEYQVCVFIAVITPQFGDSAYLTVGGSDWPQEVIFRVVWRRVQ
jgi:hypothetical protein